MLRPVSVGLLTLVMAAMLALLLVGVQKNYSPIPHSDMWMGGLGFYLDHLDGKASVWWRFHNEHPNHLARLLFWFDYEWFGGRAIMLQAFNVLVLLGIAVFMGSCTTEVLRESSHERWTLPVALSLAAWQLQWSQQENIVWAFQGVFFLAQLLPCVGAYLLSVHAKNDRQQWTAWAAVLLGCLAWGTMANAIFAFPLMAVVAWRVGCSKHLVGFLVVLCVLGCGLYWLGLAPQGGDLDRRWAGAVSWSDRGIYLLSMLGGPFKALRAPDWLAQVAGAGVLCLVVWHGLVLITRRGDLGVSVALRGMTGYLTLTALMATMGRAQLGYEQAFSSRYQTPMLMLWAVLLMLHLRPLLDWVTQSRWRRGAAIMAVGVLSLMLLERQCQALRRQDQALLGKELALLQLELQLKDEAQLLSLGFPSWEGLSSIANRAMAYGVSPFSTPVSLARRALIGKTIDVSAQPFCENGAISKLAPLRDSAGGWRTQGWLKTSRPVQGMEVWHLVQNRKVVGVLLSGLHEPEMALKYGRVYERNGFVGYALGMDPIQDISIWNPIDQCKFTVASQAPAAHP